MAVDDREVAAAIERALAGRVAAPIAEISGGSSVCIAGVVQEGDGLPVAPVSRRPCALWQAEIHHRRYPFHAIEGETAVHTHRGVPFVIVDGRGGRAVIDPEHARIRFARTRTAITEPGSRIAHELLDGVNVPHRTGEQWVRESMIVPGDEVIVIGTAMREVDPDALPGGYRDQAATRLRVCGTVEMPIVIAHQRAGVIPAQVIPLESPIADVSPGTWAIVTGSVDGVGVAAPATRRQCTSWSIVPHATVYPARQPLPAIVEQTPFWLADEIDPGCRIMIDPAEGRFDAFGVETRSAPFSPELDAVLAAHGAADARWVEETVVPLQDGVAVEGYVIADPDDDGARPARLRLVGVRDRPLIIRPR